MVYQKYINGLVNVKEEVENDYKRFMEDMNRISEDEEEAKDYEHFADYETPTPDGDTITPTAGADPNSSQSQIINKRRRMNQYESFEFDENEVYGY